MRDVSKLKGDYRIYCDGNYVVLLGEKMYISAVDGKIIACRADVKNAFKALFLPNHRVFVDGGQHNYHLISLIDGTEIWSIPQSKRDFGANRLVCSSDFSVIYDFYWRKESCYFVSINLETATIDEYRLISQLRTTRDVICDHNDIPCVLQCHYSVIDNKRISENGVLYQYQDVLNKGSDYYWKYKWTLDAESISYAFLGDVDKVLTDDLYVVNLTSGEIYYLLENDPNWCAPTLGLLDCKMDSGGRYIILKYAMTIVVVDWPARRKIAQYATSRTDGCIVNNEFWVCSKDGLQRKPFPLIEDVPPYKPAFFR